VVEEEVSRSLARGSALDFSTSDRGGLAYVSTAGRSLTRLRWLDRTGVELGTVGVPGDYQNPMLSPDETRLAVQKRDDDIWTINLVRGGDQRFKFDDALDMAPLWTPQGDQIVFMSYRNTRIGDLWVKGTAGDEAAVRLLRTDTMKVPTSWSADGAILSYTTVGEDFDIRLLTMPENESTSFLSTVFAEGAGVISPDGRWMAYRSNESGERRIYLQSFPSSGGQWPVSTAGGVMPRWSADGQELYWVTLDHQELMAVDIDGSGDTPVVGIPHALFRVPFRQTPIQRNVFDVSSDGQRFLVNAYVEGAVSAQSRGSSTGLRN